MLNKQFDIKAFNAQLDATLETLKGAERITKETLRILSREMLDAIHVGGDIQPVNRLLEVLTPMNRKTCVLFFQEFSGHLYSENEEKFTKRDKGNYAKKEQASAEFLDDPMNNIWSWVIRKGLEVGEPKEFTLLKITKQTESLLKKADKAGFKQADVFKAMIAGGLEMDTITAILVEMGEAEIAPAGAEEAPQE